MARLSFSVSLAVLVLACPGRAQDKPEPSLLAEDERGVAAARRAGADFERDRDRPGAPVTYLSLTPKAEADIELAAAFPHLESLSVYHEGVTDAALARIGRLTQLKSLSIYNAAITDDGLSALRNLTGLKHLEISQTPVTDTGFAHIGALTRLEGLRLVGVPITDAGLVHLEGLTEARSIFLHNTAVTPAGVNRLKEALPYAIVVTQPERESGWGSVLAAAVVVVVGIGLLLLVRRARRLPHLWAWKAAPVAVLIGLIGIGLALLAPVMRPVRKGDAGTFWLHVTGLDVGAEHSWSFGRFYRPRDGWYPYEVSGFHGSDLYQVPEAEVRDRFPRVAERLRNAPPGRLRPDVEQAFRDWERTGAGPDDMTGFLERVQAARYARSANGRQTLDEYVRKCEAGLDERWERAGRYRWNVVFEFAYLSGLIVFAAWPWLRRRGRVAWAVHLGLVPTLLFVPYWLGYAQLSMTSAGPTGGVLYPWLIFWCGFLRDLSWQGIDLAILRRLPQPLETLSQTPGAIMSLTGFGGVGPTATLTAGAIVALLLLWRRLPTNWLLSRLPFTTR
jgi:hypothetical protein